MRKKIYGIAAAVCLSSVLAAGCGGKNQAETLPAQGGEPVAVSEESSDSEAKNDSNTDADNGAENSEVAAADETAEHQSVGTEGMTPMDGSELKDGVYEIQVDSSSSMFKIEKCELTVKDGEMTADMKMGGTGYLKLFIGSGEAAAKASEDEMIPFEEDAEGSHHFMVPVEALDKELDCAAFSKKKEKWYDRVLVFRADSLPADALTAAAQVTAASLGLADGTYTVEVSMEGGSGRVTVESPATLTVKLGAMSRTVEVNGARQYDLNLGRRGFYEVSFEADGDLYLDNIHVYNFVQDGQLRDIDGNELSCMSAMRSLNASMD